MGIAISSILLVLLGLVLSLTVSSASANVSGPASDGGVVDLGTFPIVNNEITIGDPVPIPVEYDEKGGPLSKRFPFFPNPNDGPVTMTETFTNVGVPDITDWHEVVQSSPSADSASFLSGSIVLDDGEVVQGTLKSTGAGTDNVIEFDFPNNPQITGNTFTITKVLAANFFAPSISLTVLEFPTGALCPVPSVGTVPNCIPITDVGDFKCYTHDVPDSRRFVNQPVTLTDQFIDNQVTTVIEYVEFCNSADKDLNGQTPIDFPTPFQPPRDHHLKCYTIDPIDIDDTLVDVTTLQFGTFEDVNVLQAVELCTPASKSKSGETFPSQLDQHWLCYEISAGSFISEAFIKDQFSETFQDETLIDPFLLCNPVSKTPIGGEPSPIPLPDQHLLAFRFLEADGGSTGGVSTFDQFGRHDIFGIQEDKFFVSALKEIVPPGCVQDSDCAAGDGVCDSGERCDTGTGMCVSIGDPPLSTACEIDGDACTIEHCDGLGSCVFLSSVVCDDTQFCTLDSCEPASGCVFVPNPAPVCEVVGGEMIPVESTTLILAGTQMTAAWVLPVIVSAIGFAIVIARKF